MALTAPGSISNSSSKPFSNLFGRIAMDNHNILEGSISSYDYYALNKQLNKQHKQTKLPSKKYPNLKPKTLNEVILSTGLIH